MNKHFLTYVLVNVALLIIQGVGENKKFVLKKTPQLPNAKMPTSFAVRSDDDILALEYSSHNQSQFVIYTDPTYKTQLHNENITQKGVNSISYSDSGIYFVQDKNIQKYPFIKQTSINLTDLYKKSNMISIDQKTKIFTFYNGSQAQCPKIRVMKPFTNETYDILYETADNNCSLSYYPAKLKNLHNGMIAMYTSTIIYVLDKKNISRIITKINVTEYSSYMTIDDGIEAFYDSNTNTSMISIQGYPFVLLYVFDHQKQTYIFKSQFDNYGQTRCRLYDMNTCLTFVGLNLIKIDNIHHQKVQNNYTNENNPLENITVTAVSSDSLRLAGYNTQKKTISIFNVVSNNVFSVNKTISLQSKAFKCVTKMQFIRNDNDLIMQALNCDNKSNLSNICVLNILNSVYTCIPSNAGTNTSSFAIIHELTDQTLSRLITVNWIYNSSTIQIQCRLNEDDLKLDDTKNKTFENEQVLNVKILYTNEWKERFNVIVLTRNNTITIKYRLESVEGKIVRIVQTQIIKHQQIWFQTTVAFKEYLVTFVAQYIGGKVQCVLKFYNENLQSLEELKTNFSDNDNRCDSVDQYYRLISQENTSYLIVQRLFYPNINDFYTVHKITNHQPVGIKNKQNGSSRKQPKIGEKLSKRSMFGGSYMLSPPFILPQQNVIVYYSTRNVTSNLDKYTMKIYNLTILPLFSVKIKYYQYQFSWSYAGQFAYSSPITNPKNTDQIISFSIYQKLITVRNPTLKMIEIENTQGCNNYNIEVEGTSLSAKTNFFGYSSIYMASTEQHLISTLKTNDSSQYLIAVTEVCQKHQPILIWNFTQLASQTILDVDISKNGYAFFLKQNSFSIEPYFYKDNTQQYTTHGGVSSSFQKIQVTKDDKLFYTLKSSIDNYVYGIFKNSEMMKDYQYVNEALKLTQIKSIQMSLSGSVLLIQTQSQVISCLRISKEIFRIPKDQDFVDMYMLEADSIASKKDQIDSKDSLQNTQYTILIRHNQYTLFYSSNFGAFHNMTQIKGNMILAVSESGGLIAYADNLPSSAHSTQQIIKVMKIQSYGDRQLLENITLTPRKMNDGNEENNNVTIVDMEFSSLNTLCILATASPSSQQISTPKPFSLSLQSLTKNNYKDDQYPAVLYMYSQQGCNITNSYADGNICKCLQNFTETSYSSQNSKGVEISQCQCINNFILDQQLKCLCPTWQGFSYNYDQKLCFCDDGYIQNDEDGRPVKVCTKYANLTWLWIFLSLLIVYLIGFFVFYCLWKRKNPEPKFWHYVTFWPIYRIYACFKKPSNGVRKSLLSGQLDQVQN